MVSAGTIPIGWGLAVLFFIWANEALKMQNCKQENPAINSRAWGSFFFIFWICGGCKKILLWLFVNKNNNIFH